MKMKITKEQISLVLEETYQYWDGYYIPRSEHEQEKIDEIFAAINEKTLDKGGK